MDKACDPIIIFPRDRLYSWETIFLLKALLWSINIKIYICGYAEKYQDLH